MFDAYYRKRLHEDLSRWQERGWVSREGGSSILASLDSSSGPGYGLAAVVAVLGALLIGFGVLAFVGANWEYMPRLFRFALLIALLAVAYFVAGMLETRGYRRFADAAVLVAALVFAAAIALVGQTYHMAGDFADAVLLWLIGAGAGAVLTRSVSAATAAIAGTAYWTWLATFEAHATPHWGGLIAVLALGAVAVVLDSRLARTAAILALGFWIVATLAEIAERFGWSDGGVFALLACLGLAFWAAGVALSNLDGAPRLARLGHDLLLPALGGFLLALAAAQIGLTIGDGGSNNAWMAAGIAALVPAILLAAYGQWRGGLRAFDVAAVAVFGAATIALAVWNPADDFAGRLAAGGLVILAALWWISLGQAGHPVGSKLGLFAFGAEVLYLYSVTLGSLIDTALAFLAGGLLFIALAYVLFRLDRKLAAAQEAA